jgi:AraC-like DNA-binding protein
MMLQQRQLTFRPSSTPGIISPVTVRSTGHYKLQNRIEENPPRGFTQLFWVANGASRYFRSGVWHLVRPGDTFFYTDQEAHKVQADETICEYFWITFDGPFVGNWLGLQFPGPGPRRAGSCPVSWFEELKEIISRPTISAEREAAELGLRLLMKFTDSAGPYMKTGNSREEDFCQRLEHLIHQHYTNPEFGIEDAARQLGRHRTTVFRVYREQRGIMPSAYLQRMRLKRGLELLRRSNMNITEIAQASGYRDANYFTKVIRQATGDVPREVRKQS